METCYVDKELIYFLEQYEHFILISLKYSINLLNYIVIVITNEIFKAIVLILLQHLRLII